MDFEDLSRRLLEEESRNWPEALRSLPRDSFVPERIDAKVQAAIASALLEEDGVASSKNGSSPFPRLRHWRVAASLTLIFGLGLYLVLAFSGGSQREAGRLAGITGEVEFQTGTREEDGKTSKTQLRWTAGDFPTAGMAFPKGARVHTLPGSTAQLYFLRKISVRLGPQSKLLYLPADDSRQLFAKSKDLKGRTWKQAPRQIQLQLIGELYYKSPKLLPQEEFLVEAPTAFAHVRGTEYLFQAETDVAVLRVYEGSVEVSAKARPNRIVVEAGEEATVDAKGNIQVRKHSLLSKLRRNYYRQIREASHGPAGRAGGNVLDENLKIEQDADIRRHYGRLYGVTLKDGRQYTGYPVLQGNVLQIHTRYGIVEMDLSDVAGLKELPEN